MGIENIRDEEVSATPVADSGAPELDDALQVPGPTSAVAPVEGGYADVPQLQPPAHLTANVSFAGPLLEKAGVVTDADEATNQEDAAPDTAAKQAQRLLATVVDSAHESKPEASSAGSDGPGEPGQTAVSDDEVRSTVFMRPLTGAGLLVPPSVVMADLSDKEPVAAGHPPENPEAPEAAEQTARPNSIVEDDSPAPPAEKPGPEHSSQGADNKPTDASQTTASRPRTVLYDTVISALASAERKPELAPAPEKKHLSSRYARENLLDLGIPEISEIAKPAGMREFNEDLRREHLEGIPTTGFESEAQLVEARSQLAAIGYPLDKFNELAHERNERGTENENTLGSWEGFGVGRFTVYDLLHEEIPEKRLATMGHESAHSCSPNKGEDTVAMWGTEARQEQARLYVEQATQQALETNIHFNGYHKHLMEDFRATRTEQTKLLQQGAITQEVYNQAMGAANYKMREETWAILNEMALTRRNELERIQEQQHRKIDDLNRIASAQGVAASKKVDLITPSSRKGVRPGGMYDASSGIDTHMITLLEGVHNMSDLRKRVADLKTRFYPNDKHRSKANARLGFAA